MSGSPSHIFIMSRRVVVHRGRAASHHPKWPVHVCVYQSSVDKAKTSFSALKKTLKMCIHSGKYAASLPQAPISCSRCSLGGGVFNAQKEILQKNVLHS